MPQVNILKAYGLYTYPNTLGDVPEGAMSEATNVVIDRNHVVEPRRGFKTYGSAAGAAIKQLLTYKDRLIRHYGTTLAVDSSGSGTFIAFSGSVTEPDTTTGLRIRGTEVNSNLYITSSSGVRKISAASSAAFTPTSPPSIVNAGGIKAVDASFVTDTAGTSLTIAAATDFQVAYRIVWGYRDANSNLILGTPSSRLVVALDRHAAGAQVLDLTIAITMPPGLTSSHFFQVYRTKYTTAASTSSTTVEAAAPGDECYLVDEVTPASLTAGVVENYLDVTPDDLLGTTFLYTNANSGEGILQANEPPPFCKDITSFKNSIFYANTRNRHRKYIDLFSVTALANLDKLVISDGTNMTSYVFSTAGEAALTPYKSPSVDPSIAVEETAKSLVRVINKVSSEIVSAFYLSGTDDTPGKILLERKDLTNSPFFLYTTEVSAPFTLAGQFNPNIGPGTALTNTIASPTVITTASAHGLSTGDKILIYDSNSTPSINGAHTATVTGTYTLTIPVNVTIAGTLGFLVTQKSDAEEAKNRVYFSKSQQPEAVPISNYLDIGPKDKAILRIIALRDSLFALKEEAIYRISGESAFNFSVSLFDSSANLAAPDSAIALNNLVYMLSGQGVATVSDTGVGIISRPIENLVNKIGNYSGFVANTFGMAYESDRSYLLHTVSASSDTVATQCFRFNTFTQSWTKWDVSKTCGIVKSNDSKIYFGCTDGFVEQERKDFTRLDHADREVADTIGAAAFVTPTTVQLSNTSNIDPGDVLLQTQYLTIADYHKMLRKLDIDPGITATNFYSLLSATGGDDLAGKLLSLITKLNIDPDVADTNYVSTANTNPLSATYFSDLQTAFNVVAAKLNADNGVFYQNYRTSVDTVDMEVTMTAKSDTLDRVTLRYTLPLIVGPIARFKRIDTTVVWAPQSFGDSVSLKQIREGTVFFEENNFHNAVVSYSSDLQPGFEPVSFNGGGFGVWGFTSWGDENWGGDGTSAPFRTYIPQQKQRCRFIRCKFGHNNALEKYAIFGIGYTVEVTSTRAYR